MLWGGIQVHLDRAGGLKRSCACLQPVSVNPCMLEEQLQPWGALQHSIHCTTPKTLLLFQWVFLMLVFGGCKTCFHMQRGAEGQQCPCCSVCPCLQMVMWTGSSQPSSGDGNLNFQQYCSTGQNYILMTDLLDKQGKGVMTCLCLKF